MSGSSRPCCARRASRPRHEVVPVVLRRTQAKALLLPDAFLTYVVAVLLLGFPLALVLAWAFEVTPQGVRKTEAATPEEFILLGEPDSAAVALTRAGQPGLAIQKALYALWHPVFDPIRSHPALRDYMARIGLGDATVRRTPPERRELPPILRRGDEAAATP